MSEREGGFDPRAHMLTAQRRALGMLSELGQDGWKETIDAMVADVIKDPTMLQAKRDMVVGMGLALRNDPSLNGEKVQKFILGFDSAARDVATAAVLRSQMEQK